MLNHYLKEAYNIDKISEAGKWMLKGTDTSIFLQLLASMNNRGMSSTARSLAPSAARNWNNFVKKEDLENAVNTAVANIMNKLETLILTSFIMSRNNMQMGLCHFCGEAGHMMTRGCYAILKQYLCVSEHFVVISSLRENEIKPKHRIAQNKI